MSRHGYRGDGAFGQFCLVLPEQDAVVAITGGTEAMQAVLDHVWDHLLPGLGSVSPDEGALRISRNGCAGCTCRPVMHSRVPRAGRTGLPPPSR